LKVIRRQDRRVRTRRWKDCEAGYAISRKKNHWSCAAKSNTGDKFNKDA